MTFDFDTLIDRSGTGSIKWDWAASGELPLWVADMDFRSPAPVIAALQARVAHGVFGYTRASDGLRDAVVEWLARRYAWRVEPEAIVFVPGVVTGFNLALRAFTHPGAGLLIQTPVYPPILHAAEEAALESHAMQLSLAAGGRYTVDFDRFAATFAANTRMFLLCNPHNPVGRVFTAAELARMAELCLARDVLICSDEIHADLIFAGHKHVPIAALAPEIAARTVTLFAPSKTFNIAGLDCSFAIIPDPELRKQYNAARGGLVGHPNLLAYAAAEAAYREGEPWLEALLAYLAANRDFLAGYVSEYLPGVRLTLLEGTYLAWLDCRAAGIPGNPYEFFRQQAHVMLNDGLTFGPGGAGFVRLNFGAPRALLAEALERMAAALAAV